MRKQYNYTNYSILSKHIVASKHILLFSTCKKDKLYLRALTNQTTQFE